MSKGDARVRLRDVEEFAASLRALKDRADRSYGALARRLGISSSALHRYCSGAGVPPEYALVERFGKACGASREELVELHRRWVLAGAARERAAPHAETPADQLPVAAARGDAAAGPERPGRRGRLALALTAAFLAVLVGLSLAMVLAGGPPATGSGRTIGEAGPLLLSRACPPVVSMGEHDACVREVQVLLARAGGRLGVDSSFGPETLRRVTAFQVLAGLSPNGVVDEPTKRALYAGRVPMGAWTPARVEREIRGVFVEDPDRAVAIARCQSLLDPLWVLPNTNGSRNWGVFQISDSRLAELGGDPGRAFDPAWNIRVAHRLWAQHRDFRHWKYCDQAAGKPTPR